MKRKRQRRLEASFGRVIKVHRERLNLSQEALAFECGLHRTYVSQVERGLKSPSLSSMQKLASALGVSLPDLLRDTTADVDAQS